MNTVKIVALTVSLACAGCNDEVATPTAEACQIDAPTLVLAETPDWDLDAALPWLSFQLAGDRLLLSDSGLSWAQRDYDLLDLCGGGERERVLSAEQGFFGEFVRESSVGPMLFAWREGDGMFAVDRLAEPEFDAPRRIAGVPVSTVESLISQVDYGAEGLYFERISGPHAPDTPRGAAGIGALTRTVWGYSGEPDDDAFLLASDVIMYRPDEGTTRVLVHTDDGRVRRIDRETGAEELVREGVRWISRYVIEDRPYFVLQAIVDGQTEPVILRDVATGEERTVTVNPFADMSFGQDPAHPIAGQVYSGPVFGLFGPDRTLIEAYDNSTLAPIDIPAHVGVLPVAGAPAVGLVLADPVDRVLALWDPATGAVTEWFRGSSDEAGAMRDILWRDGVIRIYAENPDGTQRIVEVDPATRAQRVLLPRYERSLHWFDDDRVLHALEIDPELHTSKVVLSDLTTGVSEELVARTRLVAYDAKRELLLYTDREATTPGLWVMPLP